MVKSGQAIRALKRFSLRSDRAIAWQELILRSNSNVFSTGGQTVAVVCLQPAPTFKHLSRTLGVVTEDTIQHSIMAHSNRQAPSLFVISTVFTYSAVMPVWQSRIMTKDIVARLGTMEQIYISK